MEYVWVLSSHNERNGGNVLSAHRYPTGAVVALESITGQRMNLTDRQVAAIGKFEFKDEKDELGDTDYIIQIFKVR